MTTLKKMRASKQDFVVAISGNKWNTKSCISSTESGKGSSNGAL